MLSYREAILSLTYVTTILSEGYRMLSYPKHLLCYEHYTHQCIWEADLGASALQQLCSLTFGQELAEEFDTKSHCAVYARMPARWPAAACASRARCSPPAPRQLPGAG